MKKRLDKEIKKEKGKASRYKCRVKARRLCRNESPIRLPFYKPYAIFKGSQLNKERLFNALTREGVSVYKPSVRGEQLYFAVNLKDKSKTFAICDKLCYNVSVYWENGIKRLFEGILYRVGIPAGALLLIAAALMANTFVWKIEISGNEKVDSVVIQRFLEENNIRVGGKKNFQPQALALMLNGIDGIEDTTVQLVGNTLKISVVESTEFLPPDQELRTSVVSDFDGVVTRIIVNSGTAAVKIGDVVKKGDVLIKGEFINQAGEAVEVAAKGEVYGQATYSAHKTVSTVSVEKVYGKPKKKTRVGIFGIGIGRLRLPSGCEGATQTKKLWLVPLRITTLTYRKVTLVTRERDIEELKAEFIKETRLRYGVINGKEDVNVRQLSQNTYRINVYVTAEIRLA